MTPPALSIRNLKIQSPNGRDLLRIEALDVAPGEVLAIRGPSGAGKSTLLLGMAGLVPVATGSLRWGDIDLAAATDAQKTAFRGATLGIVFQDHLLFEELSAGENAALSALFAPRGERQALRDRAARALDVLGLPAGDGKHADRYSGGERQRIAVARALATDPAVILADEPTAALDRAHANGLIQDLFGAARAAGRTLIAASHDEALLAAADRVLTIDDGLLHD